ncbi:hypothetical protein PRUPE_2G094800 [Prunus persica]|uniref:Uncharacterized protein n=1 Tax=Prunus persica TaxID=3760 RepID=A0A251QDE8_PRUPE|nr:hypothetical protein PRUPE_2G094800 [Prunus persica]
MKLSHHHQHYHHHSTLFLTMKLRSSRRRFQPSHCQTSRVFQPTSLSYTNCHLGQPQINPNPLCHCQTPPF